MAGTDALSAALQRAATDTGGGDAGGGETAVAEPSVSDEDLEIAVMEFDRASSPAEKAAAFRALFNLMR